MDLISKIIEEREASSKKFPNFNTPHEGYAVILEEVDELWEVVKSVKYPITQEQKEQMSKECVQIGAMALKFLESLEEFKSF